MTVRTSALTICSLCLAATVSAQTAAADRTRCKSNDPDISIAGCTALIASGKDTADNLALAFYNRGVAYRDKRDYDHARRDLGEAIWRRPTLAAAFVARGMADQAERRVPQAEEDYDRAIQLDPTDSRAFAGRGLLYFEVGLYGRARQDFETALKLEPGSAIALYGYGMVKGAEGDLAGRDENVAAARRIQGNIAQIVAAFGVAAQYPTPVYKVDQNDPGLANLGLARFKQGRYAEARTDWESVMRRAARSSSDYVGALYGRGVLKLIDGDRVGGEADIAAAKALNSTAADVWADAGVKP